MHSTDASKPSKSVKKERSELLDNLSKVTEKTMVALAIVWIVLAIMDLVGKLGPNLQMLSNVIWALFGLDFLVKFLIAPHKTRFLRDNWILLVSLILPAFRLLRVLQALNALRALSLVRILTSLNISIGALADAMGRRGAGYVSLVTVMVLFGGAAAMYKVEQPSQLIAQGYGDVVRQGGGLHNYSDALWWTAMLMTTIGSQYWPVTTIGRALCFLLSMFSLGVFGYITAALASFFVDKDASIANDRLPEDSLNALRDEVRALRLEVLAAHDFLKKSRDDV
jgi:voltage-gated potassium channel